MFSNGRASATGITLIEMMIVVAIVAILAAIAAPDMRQFFINNRLATANSEFITALNLARNEAIRRGQTVTIRRAASGPGCTAASRNWTCGWEVFVDLNNDGVCNNCNTSAAGENTIQVAQPLASPLTLYSSPAVSRIFPAATGLPPLAGGLAEFVQFTAEGRIPLVIDAPDVTNAIYLLCYEGVANQGARSRSRAVLLSESGRTRQAVDSNNDGRVENERGQQLGNCTNPT